MSENTSATAEAGTSGTEPVRTPADQALQVVDVAVGAPAVTVENARRTVEQLRDPKGRTEEIELLQNRVGNLRDPNTRPAQVETLKELLSTEVEKAEKRGGEVRRQVTDQVVEQARKARERVEPVYRDRVEPVYKQRVEPTVERVRERI